MVMSVSPKTKKLSIFLLVKKYVTHETLVVISVGFMCDNLFLFLTKAHHEMLTTSRGKEITNTMMIDIIVAN